MSSGRPNAARTSLDLIEQTIEKTGGVAGNIDPAQTDQVKHLMSYLFQFERDGIYSSLWQAVFNKLWADHPSVVSMQGDRRYARRAAWSAAAREVSRREKREDRVGQLVPEHVIPANIRLFGLERGLSAAAAGWG